MELQPLRRLFGSSVCHSCRTKLSQQSRRTFATSDRLRAQDDAPQAPPFITSNSKANSRRVSQSGSLFQTAGDAQARQQQQAPTSTSDSMGDLMSMFNSNQSSSAPAPSRGDANVLSQNSFSNLPSLTGSSYNAEPFVLSITTHKHNTHLSLTGPFPPPTQLRGPHDRRRSMSLSAGNIGFKKAGRGSYDAAYQLAAFVFGAINERDILPMIQDRGMEVRYRGFGKGREAVTKALLGQEGRMLRGKVVKVSDVSEIKFGGVRSRKPRRLG